MADMHMDIHDVVRVIVHPPRVHCKSSDDEFVVRRITIVGASSKLELCLYKYEADGQIAVIEEPAEGERA